MLNRRASAKEDVKASLSQSVSLESTRAKFLTYHSSIPSAIAAFAVPQTIPKQTLSLVITAVEMELKAQISDIVPSMPIVSPGQLSFESANHTGTMIRYVSANGVMSEQDSKELIETGAAALQFSFHQLMTTFID